MALFKSKTDFDVRDHVGVEVAALGIVVLASAAFAAWTASRVAQDKLDERTRTRLLPGKQRVAQNSEGQ